MDPNTAPRPLILHLAIQNMTLASSLLALPSLKNGSIAWKASLSQQAKSLRTRLSGIDDDAFKAAVTAEAANRVAQFGAGVAQFRTAERSDAHPPLPTIWQDGSTRVLHAAPKKTSSKSPPVILIPSLINRASILDLSPNRSLTRHLQSQNIDTYLVDWDAPSDVEQSFSLDDYIARLAEIRDHVTEQAGARPALIGYCMGGLLALACAIQAPEKVAAFAALATPWDFDAVPEAPQRLLAASMPALERVIETTGELPVDVLQAMFAGLDPGATVRKFREFAELDPQSAKARAFVALEDWLNDGVPLAGKVARTCLRDWYIDNTTAKGVWRIGKHLITPKALNIPSLAVIPSGDVIVPPASAQALADALPNCKTIIAKAGHIGMVAGSGAKRALYTPLTMWLSNGLCT